MNAATVREIFTRFKKQNPTPTTELSYNNEFELLIAVILSARATDISVNKATKKLFHDAGSAQKIFELGEDGLKPYIKTIGLYITKAKNVVKTCEILIKQYAGKVPHTREELEMLPGVGRKTANVILNTLFGESTIAVDTHIFRVANRTKMAPGKNVREVENKMLKVVPKEFLHDAHHWMVLHGRYICVARKPKCAECIINDLCEYDEKNL